MSTSPIHARGLRAVTLAAALAVSAAGVQAAAFTLTALANVDGNSPPGTNIMDGNANGGDFFASPSGTTGELFFHTYGFASPDSYFGARVSGSGTFYGKTSAGYVDRYVNTASVDQLVTFTFTVDQGGLDLAGTGTGFADLDLVLKFNGTVVARDHTRIDGTTCDSFAGQDVGVLAGYQTCVDANSATGVGGTFSVSRLLAAGEALDVDYLMVSEVSGTFSATSGGGVFCSGGGFEETRVAQAVEDDGEIVTPGFSGCSFFNALARTGDPGGRGVSFTPANFSLTVPEPASFGLTGLALMGLLAARRRRQR